MMSELIRDRLSRWQLEELLLKYPDLRVAPIVNGRLRIKGALGFCVQGPDREPIEDAYSIEISVSGSFPATVPSVRETGGRIPDSFHTFANGTLCLGSQTRLRLALAESPTLRGFVERLVIPYLYGRSYFVRYGVMPFGELDHGVPGIRQDYAALFGVESEELVDEFVRLTGMRKRCANKWACPCGSGRRLGRCHNRCVNRLRIKLGRRWFRDEYARLKDHIHEK